LGGDLNMGRMVRKQMYMTDELDAALKLRALSLGVSEAEVVRMALTEYMDEAASDDRRAGVARLQQLWAESDAKGYGGGDWRSVTREELHERPGDVRRERARLRGRLEGGDEEVTGS
jgi:hypothetical protein